MQLISMCNRFKYYFNIYTFKIFILIIVVNLTSILILKMSCVDACHFRRSISSEYGYLFEMIVQILGGCKFKSRVGSVS